MQVCRLPNHTSNSHRGKRTTWFIILIYFLYHLLVILDEIRYWVPKEARAQHCMTILWAIVGASRGKLCYGVLHCHTSLKFLLLPLCAVSLMISFTFEGGCLFEADVTPVLFIEKFLIRVFLMRRGSLRVDNTFLLPLGSWCLKWMIVAVIRTLISYSFSLIYPMLRCASE